MTIEKKDVIAHFLQYTGSESAMVHSQISAALKARSNAPEDSAAIRYLMKFREEFPEEFFILCSCTVEDWESPA